MYQIIKHYQEDAALRRSFNELAEATFGLNFENWYQNGFWGHNYDPYSVLLDGKIVANVSVNRTDLRIDGVVKRVYQLGTVMTAEAYRHQGFIRAIMAEVEKDLQDADGVYLFANDSVLAFYPKFGFVKGKEHVYSRLVSQNGGCRMQRVPMDTAAGWKRLAKAMEANRWHSACDMVNNPRLIFFYVSQFMQDSVFYDAQLDAWVIAEQEGEELLIHNVFSSNEITLDAVIAAFGSDVKRVTLGFTPVEKTCFDCKVLGEEDSTFFVKGPVFQEFLDEKLRIPTLAHA